jgi:hypothetical protein
VPSRVRVYIKTLALSMMLDPVTITTGICALLKATFDTVVLLKAFGEGVSIIKDKLIGLLHDVENLAEILNSMKSTFDEITPEAATGHIGTHWQNISRALENGLETLGQLQGCLQEINKTRKLLDGPRKQLRLKFAAERLALYRQHVQSYRDALQLSQLSVIL